MEAARRQASTDMRPGQRPGRRRAAPADGPCACRAGCSEGYDAARGRPSTSRTCDGHWSPRGDLATACSVTGESSSDDRAGRARSRGRLVRVVLDGQANPSATSSRHVRTDRRTPTNDRRRSTTSPRPRHRRHRDRPCGVLRAGGARREHRLEVRLHPAVQGPAGAAGQVRRATASPSWASRATSSATRSRAPRTRSRRSASATSASTSRCSRRSTSTARRRTRSSSGCAARSAACSAAGSSGTSPSS